MTTYSLSPVYNAVQVLDDTGAPLVGGKIYTYLTGTATPATTWKDSGAVASNTNPIVLDASGRAPDAIWLAVGTTYRFKLHSAADVPITTLDGITGIRVISGDPVLADGSVPFTASAKFADGSSAAPAITFSADTNTGVYRSASDKIGLSLGGAVAWLFNGAKSQVQQNLDVVASATWPTAAQHRGLRIAPDASTDGTPAYSLIREVWYTTAGAATHTTTVGTRMLEVRGLGGGGGGGGTPIQTNTDHTLSAGGGGGAYAFTVLTGAEIETSYTVTVGDGGTNGAAAGAGGNGGTTTVVGVTSSTTRLSAGGGVGGTVGVNKDTATAGDPPSSVAGVAGGTATVGDVLISGSPSNTGYLHTVAAAYGVLGVPTNGGGNAMFGAPCPMGTAAWNYGQGSGGKWIYETTEASGDVGSGAGMKGLVIIREYA